jgi:hypothetical protein
MALQRMGFFLPPHQTSGMIINEDFPTTFSKKTLESVHFLPFQDALGCRREIICFEHIKFFGKFELIFKKGINEDCRAPKNKKRFKTSQFDL